MIPPGLPLPSFGLACALCSLIFLLLSPPLPPRLNALEVLVSEAFHTGESNEGNRQGRTVSKQKMHREKGFLQILRKKQHHGKHSHRDNLLRAMLKRLNAIYYNI